MTRIIYIDHNDTTVMDDFERLGKAGVTVTLAELKNPTEAEVIEACLGHDVVVSSRIPITKAILTHLPDLKLLCVPQVGFDHIDAGAAQEMGLRIGNSAYCNYTEVACHALALSLMLVRQIPSLQQHTAEGGWDFTAAGPLMRPGDMTLGIIGLGRIGKAFAVRAAPVFRNVIGYDPYLSAAAWPDGVARMETRDALLQACQIVSVHVPLSDTSRGMIDAAFLSTLPQGAFVVNTARGGVADTTAILAALNSGHIAGVGLDVLAEEPPAKDDLILTHPKAIVTPHSAFFSEQSRRDKYRMVADNALSFLETGAPKYDALKT